MTERGREAYVIKELRLGIGTGRIDAATAEETVRTALDAGYRHVDTAEEYGTERAVGRAIAASDTPRSEVVIGTKLHSEHLSYEDAVDHAYACRERLNVDTIDLLSMHWPTHTYDVDETFRAFDALVDEGVVDDVGMCNVTAEGLARADDSSDVPIAAVQVEMHPLLPQPSLLAEARARDVTVVAHTPFAGGEALALPEVKTVADRVDATPAQVCLAWLFSKGDVGAVPGATGEHVRSNYRALDVSLSPADVERIDNIERRQRFVDYEFAPWNP